MERSQELSYPLLQQFSHLSVSATSVDFNLEFTDNQTPEQFVISVNQYLRFHDSYNKINKFRVFFCAFYMFLPDIQNWIAFAVSRGVEELDLDLSLGYDPYDGFSNGGKSFKLPDFLFHCKSLRNLSFRCCEFNPPSDFTGFPQLLSLSFKDTVITSDTTTNTLAVCLNLESLRLDNCSTLEQINISALQLKSLIILNCYNASETLISAPKLQSFIYHGECLFSDVINTPSLVDAFISSLGMEHSEPEHDYIKLLYDISLVRILTICTATLMCFTISDEYGNMDLQVSLPNLQELQILMACMNSEYLSYIYGFFRLCPSPNVESLFIQLPKFHEDKYYYTNTPEPVVEEPSAVTFNHLKVIKMNNFKGCKSEMRLVKFLLEKAFVLEILFLVVPKEPYVKEHSSSASGTHYYVDRMEMEMIHGQLVSFPKSSPGAKIVLCEYSGDDQRITPTHIEHYCDFL